MSTSPTITRLLSVAVLASLALGAGVTGAGGAAVAAAETAPPDTGSETSAAAEADLTAPDAVSLQVCGGVSTNTLAYQVAQGLGLFDEVAQRFGTSVEVDTAFAGSTECTSAFLGGENDFTSMASTQAAVMASQGEEATVIMDLHNGAALVFIGAISQQESRGTDLANWEGATLAITAPGATTQTVPMALLDSAGVDPDNVTFLPVGDVAAISAALQTDQVDGAATTPTAAVRLIDAGIAYEVINGNDPGITRPLIGDVLGPVTLIGKPEFIEEYPGLTQALVEALYQALQQIQEAGDDSEAVLALLPEDIQEELSEGFAEQWALTHRALADVDPTMTVTEVQDTLAFQTTYGGVEFGDLPDTLFDNSFVVQAQQNLGIEPTDVPAYPVLEG